MSSERYSRRFLTAIVLSAVAVPMMVLSLLGWEMEKSEPRDDQPPVPVAEIFAD
ncbi:hypothetical protein [Haloglycomyces albus]|uniref:hypothetical protein n=1 Tax=Haloglycomyces albus TaxID=526067 RepID=UPI0012EC78DE|nr:hypothetical protein [Haloglycomyces albus]